MVWTSIFYDWRLYAGGLAVALVAYGTIRSTPLGRLPIFNNKRTLTMVSIIGLLFTLGIFGSIFKDTGSLTGDNPEGFYVSDLQVTTAFETDTCAGNVTANANIDDLYEVRLTDACSVETAASEEVVTGIITVFRKGSLDPYSCDVVAQIPEKFQDEGAPNGNVFSIVETNSLGEPEVYLQNAGAGALTSPKGATMLTFADGSATATLGVMIEVDEEGHDALNQYSYKPIVIDICGKPFTFNIHRMDA
jgi:hypothetical protein